MELELVTGIGELSAWYYQSMTVNYEQNKTPKRPRIGGFSGQKTLACVAERRRLEPLALTFAIV
jgi:hypothetical protein